MLRIIGGLAECSIMEADLLSSTYKDNIKAFNDQFQKAKKILEGTISMDQYQLVAGIGSSVSRRLTASYHSSFAAQDTTLQKLGAVAEAYWKSSSGCLEGTRVTLLQRVIGWARNVDNIPSTMTLEERELMRSKNILWIFGLAGAGKSTVAHTVA